MALDPYALCPCGSGKKLKFCCADLIGDIEKIHRMIDGEQTRAALAHVEQTLAKQPGRASLLDLQAMLQFSLDNAEGARATIQQFLQQEPKSATAHAQNAILQAYDQQPQPAVEALQSALELIETNLPQRVLEAIGAVGQVLLRVGDIVAARAHLWLYQSILGKEDDRALQLLVRMNQVEGVPLLLREPLALKPLPEGHPAAADMETIRRLSVAGKWRVAATQCDELLPDYLDQPIFFYNRALLSGFLADRKNFVAGMRLYARQAIPLDDAIEAEAIAQVLDSEAQETPAEGVRITYDVTDQDALTTRLIDDRRTVLHHLHPEELQAFEGAKPQQVYLLLDRPQPTDVEELTRDQIPHLIGFVTYYGRQTDRAERLELVTDRDDRLTQTLETLQAVAGDALGKKTDEQPAGSSSTGDPVLSWRWHFPPKTSTHLRRKLLAEERQEAFLQRWPHHPRKALGGISPTEAAKQEELRLPLLAALLLLEQGSENVPYAETFAQLRQQLGLPVQEPIDAGEIDVHQVPLVRLPRILLESISDPDLATLYKRAILLNAAAALQHVVREGLSRPSFHGQVPFQKLFEQLFSMEEETSDAIAVLDRARQWSDNRGQSNAPWDLLELQLHIAENNSEEANRVLGHIRDHHMQEPEVAEQIYQLLYMIGAIPPGGPQAMGAPHAAAAPPSPASGGIWTPDAEAQTKAPSKIWTPD